MKGQIYPVILGALLIVIVTAVVLSWPESLRSSEMSRVFALNAGATRGEAPAPPVILRGQSIDSISERESDTTEKPPASLTTEEELKGQPEEAAPVLTLAPLPQAYLQPDPKLALAPNQVKAIEAVAKRFYEAMRLAGNPDSPEYLEKWIEQRELANDLLISYLGPDDFSRFYEPKP